MPSLEVPPVVVGTGEGPAGFAEPQHEALTQPDPSTLLNLPPELRMPEADQASDSGSPAVEPAPTLEPAPIPLQLEGEGMVPTLEETEKDKTMTCPKCEYVQPPDAVCQMCGVIFAKIKAPHPADTQRAAPSNPKTKSRLGSLKGLLKRLAQASLRSS